jgi:hypothetical protein
MPIDLFTARNLKISQDSSGFDPLPGKAAGKGASSIRMTGHHRPIAGYRPARSGRKADVP